MGTTRAVLLAAALTTWGGCARKYVIGTRGDASVAAYEVADASVRDRRTELQ
jgi:hypothetical protein